MPDYARHCLEKLLFVPQKPGVYILKGSKEKVLYIGKAKNLKKRLNTYFQQADSLNARKSSMVQAVKDFSFITTANELEALILEANLIKQYKPKFNIILRDDKNYPYIRLTINDKWPYLEVVRKIVKDSSMYFGPYVPSGSMWSMLSFIRRNFNIRPCKYKLDKPMRPCIQYQMGRCPAPCAGHITPRDYIKSVKEVVLFLKAEKRQLLDELQEKMHLLSDEMRYEEAGRLRDRINSLKRVWESQKVIAPELGDIDVIGHYTDGKDATFQVFFIRNGAMIGVKDFYLKHVSDMSLKELYSGFIEGFYAKELIPPSEIIVGVIPEGLTTLKRWLKQKKGKEVKIILPKEGKRLELLGMASENARLDINAKKGRDNFLEQLKQRLSLKTAPSTIGAFDVSTIGGAESVGAFICWKDGEFNKDMYRHIKIKTISGMDDYAMMSETIRRVLKDIEPPHLILVDGGRGQLEVARQELKAMGVDKPVIAVAKKPDRAFTLSGETLNLEDKSPASLLLKKIRDEAHRFAISFHKKLRRKRLMESALEKIKGIGKKRRFNLLRHFGSLDAIRMADVEELNKVPGMDKKITALLKEAINKNIV